MKKILLFLFFAYSFVNLNGQVLLNLKGLDSKGNKIDYIEFVYVTAEGATTATWKAQYNVNGKRDISSVSKLKSFTFEIGNLTDFWQNQCIKKEVYENLTKNGLQYDLRQDLEIDILKYLDDLEKNNLIYEDKFLENYLYSIVNRIYPGTINDSRPGAVNVKIMKDIVPNAFIASNGTMVITTGLLTTINSEEELIGVIAHEVSHFVLDHSVINITKAEKRQKSAEFWAAFATGVVAASEIYAATQSDYYVPGALTYSTAVITSALASNINVRLGLKYSRGQEAEADNCAVELMKFINIDPTALSSALIKIKDYCIITGNYMALTGEGSHPDIDDRVKNIGYSKSFTSPSYDRTVSFVNSYNAISEYNNKHFKKCQELVDRNIAAGVPIEDDYILKAITNLCLFDNPDKNNEALGFINKAKSLNVAPAINLYKQEALVLIRLKRNQEAIKSFETYINILKQENLKLDQIRNESMWLVTKNYLDNEMEWALKMTYKVKNL